MLVINYKNNKGEFLKLRISPLLFEMKKRFTVIFIIAESFLSFYLRNILILDRNKC